MQRTRPLPVLLRAASLAAVIASAMCGVKGPPRLPLGTEDQYGKRGDGDAGTCDNLEAPQSVPVGKSTEAVCEACAELRRKREECGIKEPLGGRCKALCQRYDWKRDLDPGQDIEGRKELMREFNKGHFDAGSEEESKAGGGSDGGAAR